MVIFGQKRPILGQNMAKNDPFSTKKSVFDPPKMPEIGQKSPQKHPQTGSPTAHSELENSDSFAIFVEFRSSFQVLFARTFVIPVLVLFIRAEVSRSHF